MLTLLKNVFFPLLKPESLCAMREYSSVHIKTLHVLHLNLKEHRALNELIAVLVA